MSHVLPWEEDAVYCPQSHERRSPRSRQRGTGDTSMGIVHARATNVAHQPPEGGAVRGEWMLLEKVSRSDAQSNSNP